MAKAVISNRIYMDLPSNKQDLFDALTYKVIKPAGKVKYEQVEIIRNYRMVTPKIISIPQGRIDLIPADYEIIDKRIVEFADFPAPQRELFPAQAEIYEQVDDSCFINALVGWGKTFTALHIAYKLGMHTLVVTHTTALRDQWVEEVEKLFGIKPGVIGSGTFNIDSPIVIGNIQSLVKVIDRIEKHFGTIIMDEAHHVPATTFTELIDKMHARYRIALSGTMQRKDGKHILFPDYFGPKVYKPEQNNTMTPSVLLLKSGPKLPPGSGWAEKVTKLLQDTDYQHLVASMALIQANKGHKVLVIADRVDFLKRVAEMAKPRASLVIGETENRKIEIAKVESGECDILCGSRQIFSEGISVNCLSCVILAIPIANTPTLEQIIGRIMRLSDNKLDPIVIDIQFTGVSEVRQNHERLAFYLEKGWDIKSI